MRSLRLGENSGTARTPTRTHRSTSGPQFDKHVSHLHHTQTDTKTAHHTLASSFTHSSFTTYQKHHSVCADSAGFICADSAGFISADPAGFICADSAGFVVPGFTVCGSGRTKRSTTESYSQTLLKQTVCWRCARIHAHTHTRTCSHTSTRTRARTHAHMHSCSHTCTHALMLAHMHTHALMLAHMHTRTRARTHAHTHSCSHTCTHTHLCSHTSTRIQTGNSERNSI